MSDIATTGMMTASAAAELTELAWALRSHTGRVRDENEDCVGVYAPREDDVDALRGPVFVVADGMGGHAAGEVASRLAVENVISSWTMSSSGAPHQALRSAVRAANGVVFGASLDRDTRGMGTTLTALALAGDEGIVAHVGDSRAYQVRDGDCSQITADHTRVGEMVRTGLITPEQAAHHPARSQLTRNLGHEPAVQVDISRFAVKLNDCFVLCSDGLWDLVSRREIAQAVAAEPAQAAESLIHTALDRGAPDNVTAIVVRITAEPIVLPARPWQRWSLFRRE